MKKSIILAVFIALGALLWVLSGVFGIGAQTPNDGAGVAQEAGLQSGALEQEETLIQVRVRDSVSENRDYDIQLTGRTQAARNVMLRGEIEGVVSEIVNQKGARVQQGDVIARLEVRDRTARLEEARERLTQREIEYNAARRLGEQGFNSKIRTAQSKADLEAARALLKLAEIDQSNLEIKAPYDGVIYDQMIEKGDLVRVGDALFALTDLNPIEIRAFASERQITHLYTGKTVRTRFLNNQEVEGTLTFLAPVANPDTRTFPVEISIPNPDYKILEGLTAQIFIPAEPEDVHRISPSILALDDDGVIGIKILDEDNRVIFNPVQIVADMPDYMLVGGLPETIKMITVGQDFVVPGQVVEPVASTGDGLL